MCDNMSEQCERQLTLETVDVFSTGRIVVRLPAAKFVVPASVVADFSSRQPAPVLRPIQISRDHH